MKEIKKNNLNSLADSLIDEISSNKDPFNTYTIIFPSLLLEQWFKSYWLRKTKKVLLNVSFTRMVPFINKVFNNKKTIISSDKMALLIADILYNNPNKYIEISNYYKDNNTNLFDMANKLASLFLQYEKECFTFSLWQKRLFDEVKQNINYSYVSDIINNDVCIDNKVFVFGFTKVDNLYIKALSKLSDCTIYYQENIQFNEKVNICKAMSKEREIEYVHDEITKLLNNDVKMYDILVYCPNINEYEAVIKKVFSTGNDKNFPKIPYIITSSNTNASSTCEAIQLLYNVLINDEFTRVDFYNLISNPIVCKVRKIDSNIINDIMDALINMNVYRDNLKCDEWLYGIKRLLVAKLIGKSYVNNEITLDDNDYLPYGNISLDDNTISIICDIVTDIIEFRKIESLNLDLIKQELDKWLSYSLNNEYEDNFYYKQALNVLTIIQDNNLNIPLDIVFKAMINASKNLNITESNVINGGITFINFDKKNILASKYMFFVGLSANNLPRMDKNDELDLRVNKESITTSDINTFNYLNANSEKKYYSYVYKNLKSLEDYFVSSLVKECNTVLELGLSENRSYDKLFSKSEFNKKSYHVNLTKEKEIVKREYAMSDGPTQVKCKELSEYLNEALQAKINRLFKDYDSESLDEYNESYEPLKVSDLVKSNIRSDVLYKMFEERTSELSDEIVNSIIKKYKLTHDLPYLVNDISEQISDARIYFETIIGDYVIIDKFIVHFNDFELIVDSSFALAVVNDVYCFYEIKASSQKSANKKRTNADYTRIYVFALAYLANNENIDEDVTISLNNKKTFECNSSKAKEILNEIYFRYIDNEMVIAPLNLYSCEDYDSLIKNISSDQGVWSSYFKYKKLLNIRDDINVTKESFYKWRKDYRDKIKEVVLFALEEDEK